MDGYWEDLGDQFERQTVFDWGSVPRQARGACLGSAEEKHHRMLSKLTVAACRLAPVHAS